MKTKNIYFLTIIFCGAWVVLVSCNKNDLLNAKPQSNLAVPSSLADYQALLDGMSGMNLSTPGFGDASADNYYMSDNYFNGSNIQVQNMYLWAADIYQGKTGIAEWNAPYSVIFTSNIVIEGLANLDVSASDKQTRDNLLASALFFRAFSFWQLAQLFAPPYESSSAKTDLGIPLRLNSDVNLPTTRPSVQQTYDQIFDDLTRARLLFSNVIPLLNKNRPSKLAVLALMAKIHLSNRNYSTAGLYADSSLQMYNTLVNFNSVPASTTRYTPFNYLNNIEVFFNSAAYNASSAISGAIVAAMPQGNELNIDTNLFKSYGVNDLRKSVFFYFNTTSKTYKTNGTYSGSDRFFSGLATNEMYLIRAECNARAGNTTVAMTDLNTLLANRWKTGTYVNLNAISSADALNQILIERRKELPFSNVRWTDIRRLNKEGYNITLKRVINGQTYILPANDPRYIFPIPIDVIQFTGISQNNR